MLSANLEQTLHRALSLASDRRHEYATLEHLLLGLTSDDDAERVLRACKVDIGKLCSSLEKFLNDDLAGLATDRHGDPKPTAGFQRVVQRAAIHVQSSGRDQVTGANLLVALFSERESHAVHFLEEQDMTRLDAVNFITHGLTERPQRMTNNNVSVIILQDLVNAFNDHDLDRIMEFFADDCVLEMPRGSSPFGSRYVGKDNVRQGLAGRFAGLPNVQYGNPSHFVDGNTGITKWTVTGTTPAGVQIEANGCDFYTFRDGKITKKDSYWKIVE